ncbi:MAG TPA: hypothetical protein VFH89_09205 [Sphingomicrobium sp.]|nr:hypothetical protein [Sphingomicrobium sp.]
MAPALIFGSAVAISTATWLVLPPLDMTPVASGAAAFGGIWLALNRFGAPRGFPIPQFERPEIEVELSSVGELLKEATVVGIVEQLGAQQVGESESAEELVLDDVLEAIGPNDRVVRLFEPNDTAGKMQERIDRHLHSGPRQVPDATQELHDALAALRRSLR